MPPNVSYSRGVSIYVPEQDFELLPVDAVEMENMAGFVPAQAPKSALSTPRTFLVLARVVIPKLRSQATICAQE
jgi:hypothetical protein